MNASDREIAIGLIEDAVKASGFGLVPSGVAARQVASLMADDFDLERDGLGVPSLRHRSGLPVASAVGAAIPTTYAHFMARPGEPTEAEAEAAREEVARGVVLHMATSPGRPLERSRPSDSAGPGLVG